MSESETKSKRSELDKKISAFLSKGGEIQEIPAGKHGRTEPYKRAEFTLAKPRKPDA
ncbi:MULTISPECIES: hypothetical protein [Pseudomonas]|uniref:Transcriptional regulator SutA RNAP-binding domain-containing protein n=1 Tax=Pseudomonas nitroreducens TaxID=46680 RepID=A0ABS0KSR5_PSENT|nr:MULTISPECIES: hypothetical protein [Pseudomonas]MBG6291142.1 hypothetical protein [Pseudomonas nitroreducens]MCE4069432.1 hypothetical protein [Pseudomonas nitritireducens]MCE4079404.1 hypothetical protein [Pseudomonas nitroreducens]MCJ1882431.1 hypothetical protein [Pseudomonas nitroreducens]MCJ1893136.1 hypothetical protein [Pseudomonas nitroreducens]